MANVALIPARERFSPTVVVITGLLLGVLASSAAAALLAHAAAPPPVVVDVEGEMSRSGAWGIGSDGIGSVQADASSPARMFRVGPTDRWRLLDEDLTVNYFLEDPYAAVPLRRTLTLDVRDRRGRAPDVYFVNGDLWIDSHRATGFRLVGGNPSGVRIIATGDIHISDDIASDDSPLTLVARRRADGTGGHVFLGDPTFGTLSRVEATVRAEAGVIRIDGPTPPEPATGYLRPRCH